MPWVRFIDQFRWKPKQAVTQVFPKGAVVNATRACAEAAQAAGKAELVEESPKAARKKEAE